MEPTDKVSSQMNFFLHLGQAKRTYRTGWMLRGVKEPESIADHMYRMSIMSFLAPSHLNKEKCIQMCLIHDLAECIVGDLTPTDNVSKEKKNELENSAISSLVGMLNNETASKSISYLYEEYSEHVSKEANFVKSLDLFDMFLQAYEYEQKQNIDLSEFFSSVPKYLSDSSFFEPIVKSWLSELMKLRNNNINALPFDSNLNTVLRDILNKKDSK